MRQKCKWGNIDPDQFYLTFKTECGFNFFSSDKDINFDIKVGIIQFCPYCGKKIEKEKEND